MKGLKSQDTGKKEDDELHDIQERMTEQYSLSLKPDFYSLSFYGFYLNEDQEELSPHKNPETKEAINRMKTQIDSEKKLGDENASDEIDEEYPELKKI